MSDPLQAFDVPQEVEVKHAPLLKNRRGASPFYGVKQERPAHRLMLEFAARGLNNKEIAAQTGYTAQAVQNILRQPHTQQVLVDAIREVADTDREVIELIKEEVVESVKTIVALRDDTQAPKAIRLAAANDILNRRYGKPNQPVNRNTDVDLNALSIAEVAAALPPTSGTGTQS